MTRSDVMLWLDLETTGNSPDADIIEVGVVLTDQTPELHELEGGVRSLLVEPTEYWRLFALDEVVARMHSGSGLTRELHTAVGVLALAEVETALLGLLQPYGTEHIPLAGSGVSHFDRQYIRRDFPRFDKRLTYWAYDVGVVRRTLRLAGIELPSGDQTTKTHRALDDARQHAQEMRDYLALLGKLQNNSGLLDIAREFLPTFSP
jgi:oligoribonuclease (3'-5' exoribonuclease)